MIVRLVVVGRPKGAMAAAIGEYERRAARYWKLEAREVSSGSSRGGVTSPDAILSEEGDRIVGQLPSAGAVVALTRQGKGMTSRGLARFLQRRASSAQDVSFVVGGAYGLSSAVLERATFRLTLSPMTLPHELARLVLAEQLYRAGTIVRGEPYHKGPA